MYCKLQLSKNNRQQIVVPIRYEMKGYNSLLGSHYDHYYLDYTSFIVEKPTDDVFVIAPGNELFSTQVHDFV